MERIRIKCESCNKEYYIEDQTTIQGLKLRSQINPFEKAQVRCPYCQTVNSVDINL